MRDRLSASPVSLPETRAKVSRVGFADGARVPAASELQCTFKACLIIGLGIEIGKAVVRFTGAGFGFPTHTKIQGGCG